VLDDPKFRSKAGKSYFQMRSELCDLLVSHAREIRVRGIDVEKIVRSGIEKFNLVTSGGNCGLVRAPIGSLRATLSYVDRMIRIVEGLIIDSFVQARDSFEEGVTTVRTVRDFTQIFDSYTEFEEYVIGTLMESAAERQEKGMVSADADFDLDIRLMRFERLLDRRPFLINDVHLRQNPSNTIEWEKGIAIWGDNKQQIAQTYTNAIAAVNSKKAVGQFNSLWAGYAKFL